MIDGVRRKDMELQRTESSASAPQARQGAAVGLFESAWRHRFALLVVVLLAAAGAYLVSSKQSPTYEASTTLIFSDGTAQPFDESALPTQDHGRYLATQADRIQSTKVTAAAAQALKDGTTASDVAAVVSAMPGLTSDTLMLTATASDGARAARLADATATGYLAVLRDEARASALAGAGRMQRQYDEVQSAFARLERQQPRTARTSSTMVVLQEQLREIAIELNRLQIASREYQPAVQVIRAAPVPAVPISPVPKRDAGLAALIALLLGSAAAWAFEVRSRRRSDSGRYARALGADCLGRVPALAEEPSLDAGGHPALAGQWQRVVSAVDASMREVSGRCLLITTPSAPGQASRCAARLALAAAADGRSVVLVDADYPARELSKLAGAAHAPGLTELAERHAGLQTPDKGGEGGAPAVALLAPGRPVANAAAFYRTASFRATLAAIGQRADLVVVVGPPVLASAETGVLADAVDAVLLVVAESTSEDDILAARSALAWGSGQLLGCVVLGEMPRRFQFWRRPLHAAPNVQGPTDGMGLSDLVRPLPVVTHNGTVNRHNGIPASALRISSTAPWRDEP
jgi:Mrp family chromosome partitioning ATPase